MSADRLFQYQGLAEPVTFTAPAETITLDKWFQEPPHPPRRKRSAAEGYVVEPFDAVLAQAVVTVDSWYVEPADILRRKKPYPPSQFTAPFTPTLPPPPAAPDLGWMMPGLVPHRVRPRPRGGVVEPVRPLPNQTPNTIAPMLIPRVPNDQHWARMRHTVDRITDLLNSLIWQGFLEQTAAGVWTYTLTSGMVTDALGYTPTVDTSHNITTIVAGLVTTEANHGLTEGDAVTLVGTSNGSYNTAWLVGTVATPTTFVTNKTDGSGPEVTLGNATGGTWRYT